jgi:hypothetical protein
MATVNQRRTIHGASPMPNSLDYYEKVVRVLLDDPAPSRSEANVGDVYLLCHAGRRPGTVTHRQKWS